MPLKESSTSSVSKEQQAGDTGKTGSGNAQGNTSTSPGQQQVKPPKSDARVTKGVTQAEVDPRTNPYLRPSMPIARVRADAESGVRQAQIALDVMDGLTDDVRSAEVSPVDESDAPVAEEGRERPEGATDAPVEAEGQGEGISEPEVEVRSRLAKDLKDIGVEKPETLVDLLFRTSKVEKDSKLKIKDPVTGKNFTAIELMKQLESEGKPNMGVEFSKRRGYTTEEILDFNDSVERVQEEIRKGVNEDDLFAVTSLIRSHQTDLLIEAISQDTDTDFVPESQVIREVSDEPPLPTDLASLKEDEVPDPSRRRFLKLGATAAVGAVVPKGTVKAIEAGKTITLPDKDLSSFAMSMVLDKMSTSVKKFVFSDKTKSAIMSDVGDPEGYIDMFRGDKGTEIEDVLNVSTFRLIGDTEKQNEIGALNEMLEQNPILGITVDVAKRMGLNPFDHMTKSTSDKGFDLDGMAMWRKIQENPKARTFFWEAWDLLFASDNMFSRLSQLKASGIKDISLDNIKDINTALDKTFKNMSSVIDVDNPFDIKASTDLLKPQVGKKVKAAPRVETNKPFKQKVFRGEGDKVDTFGNRNTINDATFFATDKEEAARFGDEITEQEVELQAPLVLRTDEDFKKVFGKDKGINPITQAQGVADEEGLKGEEFDARVEELVGQRIDEISEIARERGTRWYNCSAGSK